MALTEDIGKETLEPDEGAGAEQLAMQILDSVQAGEVREAAQSVSQLMGALHDLDSDAFEGGDGEAYPEFNAQTEWADVGIDALSHGQAMDIEMMTTCGQVSVWTSLPDGYGESGIVGLRFDPKAALWLADNLPEFAARAAEDQHWEDLKQRESTDE